MNVCVGGCMGMLMHSSLGYTLYLAFLRAVIHLHVHRVRHTQCEYTVGTEHV